MKKIMAVMCVALVACALLVSCSGGADGKCDNCKADAKKVSESYPEYADALGIEGEFCDDCLAVACV